MEFSDYIKISAESSKRLWKNPYLVIPSIILSVLLLLLSNLSTFVNSELQNTSSLILTTSFIVYSLIYILIASFFLSSLIYLSGKVIKREKINLKEILSKSVFFWPRNFVIILAIMILFKISQIISTFAAFYLGKALSFDLFKAQALFILIFVILGLLILFFTYSSFYLVLENKSILNSFKKSFSLVKKTYLGTLIVIAIFLGINLGLSYLQVYIHPLIPEAVSALIITPILALILSGIVLVNKSKG